MEGNEAFEKASFFTAQIAKAEGEAAQLRGKLPLNSPIIKG